MDKLHLTREQAVSYLDTYKGYQWAGIPKLREDWLAMYDLLKEIDGDIGKGRIYWTEWRDKIRALIGGE